MKTLKGLFKKTSNSSFGFRLLTLLTAISFLAFSLMGGRGAALTQCEFDSVINQGPFYCDTTGGGTSSVCDNTPTGSQTDGGSLMGLTFPAGIDDTVLANAIDNYIQQSTPGSPLAGMGSQFVSDGHTYNVNPALIVGDGKAESDLGLGDFGEPQYNDPWNQLHSPGDPITFPSYAAAMDAYYQQIQGLIAPPYNIINVGQEAAATVYGPNGTIGPNGQVIKPAPTKAATITSVMQSILGSLGSTSTSGSTSSPNCNPAINGSTDCTTITGDPKILCEAEKYEGIYYRYAGGHQGYEAFIAGCPDPSNPGTNTPSGSPPDNEGNPNGPSFSGNPSPCATDCSGLVSIAVDEAFNLDYMWVVHDTMQGAGSAGWQPIPSSSATAGDIVTRPDHVEIVVSVNGSSVTTFGSHETGKQTGFVTTDLSSWDATAYQWDTSYTGN